MTDEYEIPEIAATERFTFMHGHRSIRPGLLDRLNGCRIYIRPALTRMELDQVAEILNITDRQDVAEGRERESYESAVRNAQDLAEMVRLARS